MGNAVPTLDTTDTGTQYHTKKKRKGENIRKYKSKYLSWSIFFYSDREKFPACFLPNTWYLERGTICTPACSVDRHNKKRLILKDEHGDWTSRRASQVIHKPVQTKQQTRHYSYVKQHKYDENYTVFFFEAQAFLTTTTINRLTG